MPNQGHQNVHKVNTPPRVGNEAAQDGPHSQAEVLGLRRLLGGGGDFKRQEGRGGNRGEDAGVPS